MNKKLLFLICFSLFLSSTAYSQDTSDAVGDKNQSWYASASFATAIWSSDYWNERQSNGPDIVVSHDSAKFEDFNNYSLGFGYRTGKFQVDLVYEDFGTVNWVIGRTVDNSARIFDNGVLSVESTNLMAQVSYDLYQSDKNNIFMLLGLGQSEHYIDTAYLMISGVRVDYAAPNTETNTSYRLGVGNRYKLNENLALEAKLNYSDYGKALNKHNTTGLKSYNIKMQAVEAGVSLKYYF